jgi:quinohemoprotein ethanol dehydrogenase
MAAQPPPHFPEPLVIPDFTINDEMALRGAFVYDSCGGCHGGGVLAGGMAPDLRASVTVSNIEAFTSVVREGELTGRGMPGYPEITDKELEELQHYIRKRALETADMQNVNKSETELGSH